MSGARFMFAFALSRARSRFVLCVVHVHVRVSVLARVCFDKSFSSLYSIMSGLFLLENAPRGVLTYLIGVISTLAGLRDLKGLYVLRRNKKRIFRANALEDATGGGGFDTDNTTTAVVDMEKKNNVVTATAVGETETGAVKEDCKDEEKCDKEKENKECKGEEEEIIAVDKDQFENMTVLERWSEPTKSDFAIVFVMGVLTGITSVLTGTGGPITFLPMVILWKGHEVHRKVLIALSSVMSACLGTGAIISTLAAGIEAPDGGLCLIITSFAMLGVVVGVRLLEYVRKETLQLLMGLLLLAVGGFVLHQAVTKY